MKHPPQSSKNVCSKYCHITHRAAGVLGRGGAPDFIFLGLKCSPSPHTESVPHGMPWARKAVAKSLGVTSFVLTGYGFVCHSSAPSKGVNLDQ